MAAVTFTVADPLLARPHRPARLEDLQSPGNNGERTTPAAGPHHVVPPGR